MAPFVAIEMDLRRQIMASVWVKAKEGVNEFNLPGGFILKGTRKIERKVIPETLSFIEIELQKQCIDTVQLFRRVPELNLKPYRALTEELRKLADQTLEIKDGAPTLELVAPKK